ncbi:MAG: nucleotidyltransferase domain-containing protein [Candidatus Sabulitectum sp.]|nr:nucleotidyltransferase domain-containing protein [Candidatus Sabulitectum sp.]
MKSQEIAEISSYLEEILEVIKRHNPLSIVLFGSASTGNSTEGSDIDLLVVLDIDKIPETYEEKKKLKLGLRKSLRSINSKIPIDLLVFTSKEIEIMRNQENSFAEEIMNTGRVLYEKASYFY